MMEETAMQRIQLDDFLNYKFLSAVEYAPDGAHAAFVTSKADLDRNGYLSWLYLYDAGTQTVSQLTSFGEEKSFVWLDNSTVLFPGLRDPALKKRVEAGEPWTILYAIDIRGGEAQEYARVPAKVKKIKPMPDGRLAVVCEVNNDMPNPHDYQGEEREKVLAMLREENDYIVGDEVPFLRQGMGVQNGLRSRLFLFDRRDGTMQPVSQKWANVDFFSVRSDEIIYAAMPFEKDKPLMYSCGVYCYTLADGSVKQLLRDDVYRFRYMDYLGDEIGIAASDMKRWGPNENPYFYTLDHDGNLTLRVKNEESACSYVITDCRYGSGSADFRHLDGDVYYLAGKGGSAVIRRLNADGTFEDLTDENGAVDCLAVTHGKILCIAMRGTHLQELYSLKDGVLRQITHFNDWVEQERTVSTPEHFTFENDGYTLDGWIMKPADFDPSKKYPAILDIHGGPKCAYGPIFYHELQYRANHGYIVIYCDPRGSEGRDNEFADVIGKYGTIDYEDLMKFTDECIARCPQIDTERMGVAGGSYGGFMTNWIICHTDRFRCGASQRGISDQVAHFATSDTGYRFPMNQAMGANIWEHHDAFWNGSPLKYANRCKTPTLFIHSNEDYRCPLQDGIEMYTALKYFGVDTRIVIFKGESHELSRSGRPTHRIRRMKEITAWLDKYLTPDCG